MPDPVAEEKQPLTGEGDLDENGEPKVTRYDGRAHLHELHPEEEESGSDDLAPHHQPGGHAIDGVNRLPELFSLLPPDEREKLQEDYLVAAVEGAKIRRGVDGQSLVSRVGFYVVSGCYAMLCYGWFAVVYVSPSCPFSYVIHVPFTYHPIGSISELVLGGGGFGCCWTCAVYVLLLGIFIFPGNGHHRERYGRLPERDCGHCEQCDDSVEEDYDHTNGRGGEDGGSSSENGIVAFEENQGVHSGFREHYRHQAEPDDEAGK